MENQADAANAATDAANAATDAAAAPETVPHSALGVGYYEEECYPQEPPCTCECCHEGFDAICMQQLGDVLNDIADYGAGPTANRRLELYMQDLLLDEWRICPCNLPAAFDEFEFEINEAELADADEATAAEGEPIDSEARRQRIKETFIKVYKDRTDLEECETDECEAPDGHEQDFECDYDYGQQMYDDQEAYYWAKGEAASAAARSRWY